MTSISPAPSVSKLILGFGLLVLAGTHARAEADDYYISFAGSFNSSTTLQGPTYGSTGAKGIVFTTGTGQSSYDFDTIAFDFVGNGGTLGATYSFTIDLRAVNGSNLPTTTVYAGDVVSFTMPVSGSSNFQVSFGASDLANISSYSMAANTTYSLMFYASKDGASQASSAFALRRSSVGAYTTQDGFSVVQSISSVGGTPGTYSGVYGVHIGTVAVPEPASVSLLAGAAVLGAVALRRRARRAQ